MFLVTNENMGLCLYVYNYLKVKASCHDIEMKKTICYYFTIAILKSWKYIF